MHLRGMADTAGNLPAKLKMTEPRYQEVSADSIPQVERDGVTVRVIAGEIWDTPGPVTEIAASPIYMDVRLAAGATFDQPVTAGHTALAYLFEGSATFGPDSQPVDSTRLIVFGDGDEIQVATETGARFLLIAGAPFGEPIFPYGPFVMNTVEEIEQTLIELRKGTFVVQQGQPQ